MRNKMHELNHPVPNLPSYHSQISAVARFTGQTAEEVQQQNKYLSLTELLCEAAKRKVTYERLEFS